MDQDPPKENKTNQKMIVFNKVHLY